MQAGFRADQVQVNGRFSEFARRSDEADGREHVFQMSAATESCVA